MPMPVLISLHDQKSHVTPYSDCLGLRNAKVPLLMLLASHDTNAGANGVTGQKYPTTPHLIVLT